MLSAEAAGALVATAVLLRVPLGRPRRVGMPAVALLGLPLVLLGGGSPAWLLVLAAVVAGVGLEVFGMGWNLAVQEHVEPAQLSRAYSYDALGSMALVPVGQLVAGPVAERFGLAPVVLAGGLAVAVIALTTLASPDVRRLPRAPSPHGAADPATVAPG
ncbi:hypothetical protein LG324_17510 [Phycicoccus jejuensis]|uniref:hypothetical protein n=1 Tax=Phycicoccus jejuensis TaxID=367299 RepID=UPI00384B0ED1